MEYQQLAPPPVPTGILHHPQASQQQPQPPPPQAPHPHIVVAPGPQQPQAIATNGHPAIHPLPSIHEDSASSRWTQYQHLWRQHHVYMNGTQMIFAMLMEIILFE